MHKFNLACAAGLATLWIAQSVAAGDAATSPAGSLTRPAQQSAVGAARRPMEAGTPGPATVKDNVMAQLSGAVGYRVYVQAWNPQKPEEDTPTRAVDQPAGISGPINALWDAARQFLSDPKNPSSVPSLLGKADLITKGVTLYDITFTVNKLSALDIQGPSSGVVYAGQNGSGPRPQSVNPNAFSLHLHIPATRLDFRSTTPDVKGIGLPRDADPHLSAQIDLDIVLGLAVGGPGQPYLQVTNVQVVAGKANVDSHNFTGDIIVGITNFLSSALYGKSFNALLDQILADHNLAADPAHGGFAFGAVKTFDLQQMANGYLQPVNAAITASGVTNYVRTGVWVKSQANGRILTLLFAPKALPLPPLKGGMIGLVKFDTTIPANKLPASCNELVSGDRLDVRIQTAPRNVLDVDPFRYGDAPMQRLTNVNFSGQARQSNNQCSYMLNGLALGYPNNVAFPPPAVASNGSLGRIEPYILVEPQGWNNPVPPPGVAPLANYNLKASMALAGNTGVGAVQANPAGLKQRIDPSDPASKWGTQNVTNGQAAAQRAGQPAPSALGTQGAQPASAGPKWGTPGTPAATAPVSAATVRSASQPAVAPSSLGSSEQRQ
jgi:hypothetical protein